MNEIEIKQPTEIELAAKKFEYLANGAALSNVLYGYPTQQRLWWMAAQALREKLEREKGCEFCKNNNDFHGEHPYIFDHADVAEEKHIYGWIWRDTLQITAKIKEEEFSIRQEIERCPICGRKLEVE